MKPRILFVDDDAAILEGLRLALYRERRCWDMVFASSASAALDHIRAASFDLLVSDMRMPKTDGATLLALVKAQWPGTVRMILSGQADRDSILRALPSTHQFLSKPCEPEILKSGLERGLQLAGLADPQARELLGSIAFLPSPPEHEARLRELATATTSTLADFVMLIASDPALAAKTLQLASSGAFGARRAVVSIEEAARYLGVELLRALVQTGAFIGAADSPADDRVRIAAARATHLATRARALVGDRALAEAAYASGLLRDVGALVPALEGADVAWLGSSLLAMWGIAQVVVDVAARRDREPTAAAILAAVTAAEAEAA